MQVGPDTLVQDTFVQVQPDTLVQVLPDTLVQVLPDTLQQNGSTLYCKCSRTL